MSGSDSLSSSVELLHSTKPYRLRTKTASKSSKCNYDKETTAKVPLAATPTGESLVRSASGHRSARQKSRPDLESCEKHREFFFEHVDDKMSRNSLEYPEEQARFAQRYLEDLNAVSTPASFDDEDDWSSDLGNVVGVRGLPQRSADRKLMDRQRAKYNKLKLEFIKLQSEHQKTYRRVEELSDKLNRTLSKTQQDSDLVKKLLIKQSAQSATNCPCATNDDKEASCNSTSEQLKAELKESKRLLYACNDNELKLKAELDALKSQSLDMKLAHGRELAAVQEKLKNQSECLDNRKLKELREENSRLRQALEGNQSDVHTFKQDYVELENQLRDMLQEQQNSSNEKTEEISRMMVELCRLQVYQPKLEMTLKVEREIKHELQKRIAGQEQEIENLKRQIDKQSSDLNYERMRLKNNESIELNKLQSELLAWQSKYDELRKDKNDAEVAIRSLKSKLYRQDLHYQEQLTVASESNGTALRDALHKCAKLEAECSRLACELQQSNKQLSETELERCNLVEKVGALTGALESRTCDRANEQRCAGNQLQLAKDRMVELEKRLGESEEQRMCGLDSIGALKLKLEQSDRVAQDFKSRFKLLQQAFDELKSRKDEEMSRLRVKLNFEQYNRQVALKGLEKELRVSLKELEIMRHGFNRQLAQNSQTYRSRTKISDSETQQNLSKPLANHQEQQQLISSDSSSNKMIS